MAAAGSDATFFMRTPRSRDGSVAEDAGLITDARLRPPGGMAAVSTGVASLNSIKTLT